MSKDTVFESDMKYEALVPTGWKVWALLFRHIADKGLSVLNEMLEAEREWHSDYLVPDQLKDRKFYLYEYLNPLYGFTCNSICGVFRTEKYNKATLLEALKNLDNLAEEILDSYDERLTCLDEDADCAQLVECIAENCRIVRGLYDVVDIQSDKERLKAIYEIVNGTCIKPMDYNLFQCAVYYDSFYTFVLDEATLTRFGITHETDYFEDSVYYRYDNVKLYPAEGYGMSLYYLFLLLVAVDGKQFNGWRFDEFFKHVDWPDSYRVVDHWKKNCCHMGSLGISSTVSSEDRAKLAQLCGRPTFEGIIGSSSMEQVLEDKTFAGLEFAQYKFLYDNLGNLDKFKNLLIQELKYLYANLDVLSDCFADYESIRLSSSHQSEYKEFVDHLHDRKSDLDLVCVTKLLCECEDYCADSSVFELPQVYSDLVERYIHYCALQDEALLAAVKGKLEDTPTIKSPENTNIDIRVREAIEALKENKIIDEDRNVLLKKENGTKYKLSELVYFLVKFEYVIPQVWVREKDKETGKYDNVQKIGWEEVLPVWKNFDVPVDFLDEDGCILQRKYDNINFVTMLDYLNHAWDPFDGVFSKGGTTLSAADLKGRFRNQKDDYTECLMQIVKEYDSRLQKQQRKAIMKH